MIWPIVRGTMNSLIKYVNINEEEQQFPCLRMQIYLHTGKM